MPRPFCRRDGECARLPGVLSKFTVHGFKSLADVTVELGQVNVFVGANGAGKSNLLEALGLLSAAVYGHVSDSELLARGVRPGVPKLYKSSFHGSEIPKHIFLEGIADSGASYRVSLLNPTQRPEPEWTFKSEVLRAPGYPDEGRSFASREAKDPKRGLIALKRVGFDDEDPRDYLLERLEEFAIYDPDTQTLRGLEQDAQTRRPVGLYGGNLAQAVLDLMRTEEGKRMRERIIDMVDWLDSFGATASTDLPLSPNVPRPKLSVRFTDRFMAQRRDTFSGYEASEGVLYLLFGAVLALHPQAPPLLAIENFDHALNPIVAKRYTHRLCRWVLSKSAKQILLTSHNPLVLDGLPLQDDRVRLFAVDRDMGGKTVVHRVTVTEKMLSQAKAGIPLSEQWVTGNFGGVPSNV